ncbi:cilium assembly protein DZIP1 [Ictalurus punctatus]|uniref:Cilium assembly protein DZIP1 n=1 Tax=Ictalurus punctatus TaxID=7998 RepID=A0A9F7RD92_ICTPU|nr:cilium assembly protein DZIP1 [Ictalurus punctatus]
MNLAIFPNISSVIFDHRCPLPCKIFLESFSVEKFCRFCLASSGDVQQQEVCSGFFQLRDKDSHDRQVQERLSSSSSSSLTSWPRHIISGKRTSSLNRAILQQCLPPIFYQNPTKLVPQQAIPSLTNSPECKPSSGHQSRPAGLAMSGAFITAPFKFRTRRESVDWRQINAIDVDRVACELDFQLLQEHIAEVTFCSLEGERCLNCQSLVDPALLKLFRLAQLTIEYLLHSQDYLALSLQAAEEQLQTNAKEKQNLQAQLQKQSQDSKSLKEELKHRKKIIASQQAMISAGLANYHKCQHCDKAFMSTAFLQSHVQRRHPVEHDTKLITDNQKDLQTMKLQEEIIRLQDQLTLAKSEMETLQKDYNTKQENDLTRKQADFMKQLEVWKENEHVRMNSKIDEVKQACQREMDSMHQKNRNLEKQVLKLQQCTKMKENMQPVQGQASSVQNSEDEQKQEVAQLRQKLHSQQVLKLQQCRKMKENMQSVQGQASSVQNSEDEQKQEVAQLRQKVHSQEIRWTTKMQKIKEEYESEKNRRQTALAQAHSTVFKEKKMIERQMKELELRLEEQQQLITSQNMQIKYFTASSPKSTVQQEEFTAVAAAPESKTRVMDSAQSSLVYKLDPIMELSEEDKDSSNFSEDPEDSQSRQQKVNELLKNTSLKKDMHFALQQSLHDKLLHLGIEPTVDGLSKTTYEAAMAHVVSVRQQRQREYAKYCKMQKDLIQNLDRRVKERTTQPVSKTKQSGQVPSLPQSRPQSNSLPVIVTQVVSGPPARQQYTMQPAHENDTANHPTQMAPHKISQFSLDEDSSEEEESTKDSPQAQKATVKSHSPGVQKCTACPAPASIQKAAQISGSQQTPVFSISKIKGTVLESEKEWTEGSEMEEISLDQLQKHTNQNGYMKALSNNLKQQPGDQGHKKTAGVAIPDIPTGLTKTNDAVWEIKRTDFEDDNNDDWEISSLEDVSAAHTSSPAPVRKSIDKSLDTSTSVWGTLTGKGQESGLKSTGTGSTLKTISDWDDLDGT